MPVRRHIETKAHRFDKLHDIFRLTYFKAAKTILFHNISPFTMEQVRLSFGDQRYASYRLGTLNPNSYVELPAYKSLKHLRLAHIEAVKDRVEYLAGHLPLRPSK